MSSKARNCTRSVSCTSIGKKMELLKSLADKKMNKLKCPVNTTKAKFKKSKEAVIQDRKKKKVDSLSTIQTRAKRSLKQCSSEQATTTNELGTELTPVVRLTKVELRLPDNVRDVSCVPVSTNSVVDNPEEPTELENTIHAESPKLDSERERLDLATEMRSDLSSECELNDCTEFFIISDSEPNNYMDSDHEFSVPVSAFCNEDNNPISFPFVVNNSPNSKLKFNKIASDNVVNITCIYRDPELKTPSDNSALAVITDQPKLSSALEYYLSKTKKSSAASPKEQRASWEKSLAVLSEINPSDLNLSNSVSEKLLSDISFFPKDLECEMSDTDTNLKSLSSDFLAFCDDKHCSETLTEECLPPLFSDSMVNISCDLDLGAITECSTAQEIPSNSESSKPTSQPQENITRSKNTTNVKKKRKNALFNVRKRKRVKKQKVLHQNDPEPEDDNGLNHRNSDLCNFTEDYSEMIQSVLEDNQDGTTNIYLQKTLDDEMTGENFAVCNLSSDPVTSDNGIDMLNVNGDNSVDDIRFAETVVKEVYSKEKDALLHSEKSVEPDKDTRTENSCSGLIIFNGYEDENLLDYEPELELQNEIESIQEVDNHLECSSDTEDFENIQPVSKPKLVLNDQFVTESLENLNANKQSDALNAQDSEECPVTYGNKPNDRLMSQSSGSEWSSKTDSQIHNKPNDRLVSQPSRSKSSRKPDSKVHKKTNSRLTSQSSGIKSSSKTDSQVTQSDEDCLDPKVNLTELDNSHGKINHKHLECLSNSDIPKQPTKRDKSQHRETNKFLSRLEEGEMQVVDEGKTQTELNRIPSQIKLQTNEIKLPLKLISSQDGLCYPSLCSSDKVHEKESTSPLNSQRAVTQKRPLPSDDSDSDSERSFKRRRILGRRNKVCQQNEEVNGVDCNQKLSQKDSDELQNDMSGDVLDSFSSTSTNLSIDKSYDSPAEGFDYLTSDMPDFFERRFQDESNLTSTAIKVPAAEARSSDIKDVLQRIAKYCRLGQISIAICIAKQYISISPEDTQKDIFNELFWNAIDYITLPDCTLDRDLTVELFGKILDLFYDHRLQDPDQCSMIISKCLEESRFISQATDMFEFCQKHHILLNETALSRYADFLMSAETCMPSLLSFLEYVKTDSEFCLPKKILHIAITRFLKNVESQSLPDFKRFCNLLCVVNSWEVDEGHLRKFIECCIQNDYWFEIAKCFRAWSKKGSFSHVLCQAFMCQLDSAGTCYAKFAAAVYDGVETLPLHLGHLFGQMGVMLMLEASFTEEPKAALEILFTLHKYNINYYELQAPLYHMDFAKSCVEVLPESAEVFVFSFTVAFAAIDICLQYERPKDAFEILQGFSKTVPETLIAPLKSKIMPQRFRYLVKLTQLLHSVDPANKGLEAFYSLLSSPELGKNVELKSLVEDKLKDIENIFNRYLISLLNVQKVQQALDLYKRCTHTFQESLNLRVQVLRGLITAAAQNDMTGEANDLFLLGCMRNIYQIEKPTLETFPWKLRVGTSWTTPEMKLAIEYFIENLSQILTLQKEKKKFENWFSVKILFKQDPKDFCPEINCLIDSSASIQAAMKRVGDALRAIDSNLLWEENVSGNFLEINSQSFYNFWKQKFPDTIINTGISKSFNVQGKVRVPFGKKLPESQPEPPPQPLKIEKLTVTKCLNESTQNSEAVRSIRLEVPVHNDEEFQKIVMFLKSKVLLKCRHLSEKQQGEKAASLARTFILENNVTSKLDRRTMKLLSEFAEKRIEA